MDTETTDIPRLIVGAGPAGLTAAGTLARLGVEPCSSTAPELSSAAPGDLGQHPVDGAVALLGARGGDPGRRRRRGVADAARRDAGGRRPRDPVADRAADARAEPRDQSDRARVRAPGPPRAGAARPRVAHGARVELGVEVTGVRPVSDGVRATLRDVATGRERHVRARYLIAADGAHSRVRRALGIPCTGPTGSPRRRRAAVPPPRSGTSSASTGYGIYDINHPDARGVLLPAGRNDRWLYGVVWSARRGRRRSSGRRMVHAPDPAGGRRRRPAGRDRAHRAFTFAAQLADRFREGERIPDRRRRPPGHPPRRHRHEHGDPRRLRPGLEARLGAARLGASRSCSTRTRPSGGRSQSTT